MIRRREFGFGALAGAALWTCRARATHGWEAYDTARPLYLEGPVVVLFWFGPHPHLELMHRPGYAIPPDLPKRPVPRQQDPVDVERLLRTATIPVAPEGRWRVELAELHRLTRWGVERPMIGARLGVIGYAGPPVTGTPTLRAEILFVGDKAYPMRSDPA